MPVRLGRRPAPDAMKTSRPCRWARIGTAAAWASQNALSTLARNRACQSASSTSVRSRPTCPHTPPAALTTMSSRFDSSSTWPTRDCTASREPRSQRCCGIDGSAAIDPVIGAMSARCTRAPAEPSASAIARPMPWAAPVTRATWPSSRISMRPPVRGRLRSTARAGRPRCRGSARPAARGQGFECPRRVPA